MEAYYAVGLGLVLTFCGYLLGRSNGVLVGIEQTLDYLSKAGAIKVSIDKNGETTIDMPEPCKCND